MESKGISMEHSELKVIRVKLDNGSEILIWNVGYEDGSVGVRIEDTSGSLAQGTEGHHRMSLSGKLKSVEILDSENMYFTHTSK